MCPSFWRTILAGGREYSGLKMNGFDLIDVAGKFPVLMSIGDCFASAQLLGNSVAQFAGPRPHQVTDAKNKVFE